jgi:hypothetical protein
VSCFCKKGTNNEESVFLVCVIKQQSTKRKSNAFKKTNGRRVAQTADPSDDCMDISILRLLTAFRNVLQATAWYSLNLLARTRRFLLMKIGSRRLTDEELKKKYPLSWSYTQQSGDLIRRCLDLITEFGEEEAVVKNGVKYDVFLNRTNLGITTVFLYVWLIEIVYLDLL